MNKRKYMAINLILFAFLYLSVSFNKEYIRPIYGSTPFWGIVSGSYSNFIAAYIISLFPIAAILAKGINLNKGRLIVYSIAILVFVILTIEELKPFFGASEVYDIHDIIANGLGSLFAIFTFEIFISRKLRLKE